MTHELYFVLGALATAGFIVSVAYGRRRGTNANPSQIMPVDLEAFRNLMEPAQREYLKRTLPRDQFRSVQRKRLMAAVDYVTCVKSNAVILQQVGESARAVADRQVAQAGEQLVDSAVRLRLYADKVKTRLYLGMLYPGLDVAPVAVADGYQELCGLVAQLRRMRYANAAVRSSAVL